MATPLPQRLSQKTQKALVTYAVKARDYFRAEMDLRSKFEAIDKAYAREEIRTKEHVRSKVANAYGDFSRIQDIAVPVILPSVEAAVTYQASVFLTGEPIFGVVAPPEFVNEGMEIQAKIAEEAVMGGWVAQFLKFFRDGFKYNICALEVAWDTKKTPTFSTDVSVSPDKATVTQNIWEGNIIKRIDPYNLILDPRVAPCEIPEQGEYAGYIEIFSRIKFKDFLAKLETKIIANVITALESPYDCSNYYVPSINLTSNSGSNKTKSTKVDFDWLAWADLATKQTDGKINYKNSYQVTTLYARILPADFGIITSNASTPQIWKFYIVNDSVLIYGERQTNAHNLIPILVGQPNEDGLGYQTKSLAENVKPIQDITTSMWNSILAARRKSIYDRVIYDPSRISEAQMNNPNPIARIPVRPSAYGKPISDSVYPFPFRDDQAGTLISEVQQIAAMANTVTGQNPVRQGQFVKGNKTQREFESVMGNANGRDQTQSMLFEAQIFTPLKHILKLNILQYQTPQTLFDRVNNQQIKIDPVSLRKAVIAFKISDGLIPSDKLMNAETWSTAMQIVGSSPTITNEYNVAPMFSYLMKQKGADLTPFEKSPEQKAYEQALAAWQQTVIEAVKQGASLDKLPPQPTPEQYNYKPGQLTSTGAPAPQQVKTNINNITNNIFNQQGA